MSYLSDWEQDNNPSLYGHSHGQTGDTSPETSGAWHSVDADTITADNNTFSGPNNDLINNSINLSNNIQQYLEDPGLGLRVVGSERVINSAVVVYSVELSLHDKVKIVVKRRYSEFKSLRDNLQRLYPTEIIPPIPEKHSLISYFINSLDNSKEVNLIETRKRYFNKFLHDVVYGSQPELKRNVLFQKFLDPNYELCWNNAVGEPPVSFLPRNLLLSNPTNPTDQNGLYLLLPVIKSFDNTNISENYLHKLDSLAKFNDGILKLNNQLKFLKFPDNKYKEVPQTLIDLETRFQHHLTVLKQVNKTNSKHVKNNRHILGNLINLGGNLNHFSLEIYGLNQQLSQLIEKFGSIIDLNYLNFESFLVNKLIPDWQEIVHQLIQYYQIALNLIAFYKYKIIQFNVLFKLKFNKYNQLSGLNNNLNVNLSNLKDLDSPSIHNLIKNSESRTLGHKSSWYKIFGGSNAGSGPVKTPADLKYKIGNLEKELDKLDQLIDLENNDMANLDRHLIANLTQFDKEMEKKWLVMFLNFIRATRQLFSENLASWQEFRQFLSEPNE